MTEWRPFSGFSKPVTVHLSTDGLDRVTSPPPPPTGQKLYLRLSMELSGLKLSLEELLTMRNVSVFKFVHIVNVLL